MNMIYHQEILKNDIEILEKKWGKNKLIPEKYKLQILLALSHYPELVNEKIKFLIKRNSIFPYASRPDWTTMFHKKKSWEYIITIDEHSLKHDDLLLKKLPFNAQIGILGHELAHTIYYKSKSFFEILLTGISYFIPSFREKFEKDTDRSALAHGLRPQLIEYMEFLKTISTFKEEYKYVHKYYLSEQEIKSYQY